MNRFPTFKRTNVLPALCESMLTLVRSSLAGPTTVCQGLQSTASSGIPILGPPGQSVFGHKPLPSQSTAHCLSLPRGLRPCKVS